MRRDLLYATKSLSKFPKNPFLRGNQIKKRFEQNLLQDFEQLHRSGTKKFRNISKRIKNKIFDQTNENLL